MSGRLTHTFLFMAFLALSSSSSKRSSGGGNQTDDISSLHGFAAIAMCVTVTVVVVGVGVGVVAVVVVVVRGVCFLFLSWFLPWPWLCVVVRVWSEWLRYRWHTCKRRSTYGKGILVAIGPHPESTHRHLKLSKAVGEKPFRRLVQRAVLVAAGVLT